LLGVDYSLVKTSIRCLSLFDRFCCGYFQDNGIEIKLDGESGCKGFDFMSSQLDREDCNWHLWGVVLYFAIDNKNKFANFADFNQQVWAKTSSDEQEKVIEVASTWLFAILGADSNDELVKQAAEQANTANAENVAQAEKVKKKLHKACFRSIMLTSCFFIMTYLLVDTL
jgi:hypothetical protein